MKKTLSIIVLGSNLAILNVLWPMKLKYMMLEYILVGAIVGILFFAILHSVLRNHRHYITLYGTPPVSNFFSRPSVLIFSLGIFSGSYFGYNYSVYKSFQTMNFTNTMLVISLISGVGSVIGYIILTFIENFILLRSKYHLVYGNEWDYKEFFLSIFANFTISEFFGIAVAFYSIMVKLLYDVAVYVVSEASSLLLGIALFIVLLLLAAGIILVRAYKQKPKY